jgi:glycosyltransferase involved in cell wall biosynthesis
VAGGLVVKLAEPSVDVRTLHHASHSHLLAEVPVSGRAGSRLDAIIVPTARPVEVLRHVLRVGITVACPVVVLCSKEATAEQARTLADRLGAAALAVDVTDALAGFLPSSAIDRLLRRYGLCSTSDLSLKRNLGLTLARGSGWQRVLFLDDDIIIDHPEQLARAAGLLDDYRAVGLANSGYQDNSVVCHAYRAVGGDQDTFIGGGAMMIDTLRTRSFFPNIYNEDWFFLLGSGVPFRAARAGVMRQRAYDPFANPARAAGEELGDTLAEGLFWLLDYGKSIDTAVNGFWGDALYRRRQFIDYILKKAPSERIERSLEAARGRSADISHKLCNDFLDAWKKDLQRWRDFLEFDVPVSSGPEKFAGEVGLSHLIHRSETLAA